LNTEIKLADHESLLCKAIADDHSDKRKESAMKLLQEMGDENAFNLAQVNEVAPMFAHALLDSSKQNDIFPKWQEVHERNLEILSAYLNELDRISSRLYSAGIPVVALKNGGIARGIYPCPGCCPMGDIDVLVERKHFRQAHQILLDEGYHFEFRSPLEEAELEAAEHGGGAEYWKILPNDEKLWLELQWRPVAGRWIRPDQEPSAEELIGRSIEIPGTSVRLLCPEDNLLQVSLHTAKHTYVRAPGFRLHLDVDRIVHFQKIDWDVFVKRVKALKVKTPVYFSLAIPRSIFDTPIPDDVLRELRPSVWKEKLIIHWLRRVGLFNPNEKKFGRIGYIVFNALLYDDILGLLRGIFPEKKWMMERYNISNKFLLPYYHVKRLLNLALKRMQT
jgi:hypothetical protein